MIIQANGFGPGKGIKTYYIKDQLEEICKVWLDSVIGKKEIKN